jgi:hypothetical protein
MDITVSMAERLKVIVFGVAVVVASLVVAAWIGSRRQQSVLAVEIDRLIRAGTAEDAARERSAPDLEAAPAPVARYLRWALRGTQYIQQVRISQIGVLRTDVHIERWMPFEAEHIVVPPATGFVWDARVKVAPFLHVRVRDAIVQGRGSGQVSLLSAVTMAGDADTPEMNSGSLHRYLAEAVWYPTALLPSAKLHWVGIDGTRALATLTDHGVSVSLEFRFADTGEVSGIYTPARWGKFSDGYRQVPWEGHFQDYRERDGILVPTVGEVGWYLDKEWEAVWNGRITAFRLRTQDDQSTGNSRSTAD